MHELEREPSHLAKSGDDSARQRGSADQPETQSRIDPIRRCVCSEKVRDGDREGGGGGGRERGDEAGGRRGRVGKGGKGKGAEGRQRLEPRHETRVCDKDWATGACPAGLPATSTLDCIPQIFMDPLGSWTATANVHCLSDT